jgi:hypothetical protein
MQAIYRDLRRQSQRILAQAGAETLFQARVESCPKRCDVNSRPLGRALAESCAATPTEVISVGVDVGGRKRQNYRW